MNFEVVCRTCLGTKSLKPIFNNIEYYDRFSLAMFNTTGLKVELNDGLPQNICIDCMAQINNSLKFRVRCKDSETKLLKILRNQNFDTFDNDYASDNDKNDEMIDIKSDVCKVVDEQKDNNLYVIPENEIKVEIVIDEVYESDKNKLMKSLLKNKKNDADNLNNESISKTNDTNIEKQLNNLNSDSIFGSDEHKNDIYSSESHPDIQAEVTEFNVKKQRVVCKICKNSLSVRSLDGHMSKLHPGADKRRMKCEYCETYVLKNKMNRHVDMIHGKQRSKCGFCKLDLGTKEALVRHIASCTEKKKKRRPTDTGKEMEECDVCHKKMQRASLKIHHRIKHAGLRPVCDHCGRTSGNKSRLAEHMRSKHGYDKFKCSHPPCRFQSASAAAMTNHERRHRGEKPYVCERCGAAFHAGYLLKRHQQSHRTEKLVKCDKCPASFKANNSLHMHRMSCHSGAAHACLLCTRAYSCRHYAVKHMRSVHRYAGTVPPLHHSYTVHDAQVTHA